MNKIRRWLKYKYRSYPMWRFIKNIKEKMMMTVCLKCYHPYYCSHSFFQLWGCYRIHKEFGDLDVED